MTREEIDFLVKTLKANAVHLARAQAEETKDFPGKKEGVRLPAEARKLAGLIDHTLLRPEATRAELKRSATKRCALVLRPSAFFLPGRLWWPADCTAHRLKRRRWPDFPSVRPPRRSSG